MKFIKFFGSLIILIFLFSYFIEYSGYYEYNLHNKKNLTEEDIKRFESDIKEGKSIDINSYLSKENIDYSNSLTRTTSNANIRLNDYLKRIIKSGFKLFGKFIE